MKNISVIIPTYNSWYTLRRCIISIQKQTVRPAEIIVVNNASTDGTARNVKKYFPKVKLFNLNTNTGVTGGRNLGISKSNSSSDYLLFLDHDMVAEKKMIGELIKVAENYSDAGIITPKIYYWGNRKRIWSAGTGINLWTGRIVFRGGEDEGQYEKTEEVQVAPAAILVKKETMNKLRDFDNIYFASYEDTDFCFRAKKLGYKTFYAPKALAYHILSWHPKDDVDRVLSRAYWVGRNRIIFMKRFGANFPLFLLIFVPLFCFYYFIISFKANRLIDWLKFISGTWRGLIDNEIS